MHREDQFIPELIVRNAPAALDFYKSVFGAEEVHRMTKPGSEKIMHGELTLDGHKFAMSSLRAKVGPASHRRHSGGRVYASRCSLTTRAGLSSVQ
jgi:uncharacterized glyoxalase superfamily protein PhnB